MQTGSKQVAAGLTLLMALMICAMPTVQAQESAEQRSEVQRSAIQRLQASGIAPDATRLVQFAAQGDWALFNQLLEAGVKPGAAEPTRQVTALHNAAAQGHERIVTRLLALGVDVNAPDWHGNTPLIMAVHGGHGAIVQRLLQHGANPNVRPKAGPTALIAAIWQGNEKLLEQLLQAGANPAQPDGFEVSPLNAAQLAGRANLAARINTALARSTP